MTPLVCLEVWVAVRNPFRRWLTRTCWSRCLVVTLCWRCSLTLPVACTRNARRVTVDTLQQNAVATCCLVPPTTGIPKAWLRSFFGKSWHVNVVVCSITNELWLSSFYTDNVVTKGANIHDSCVTRFTCIFVNASNFALKNRNFEELLIYTLRHTIEQH